MKIKSQHIYFLIFSAVTLFIFSNSAKPAVISSEQSGGVLDFICTLFNISDPSAAGLTQYLIRKAAHLAEFALQAFFLTLFFGARNKSFRLFVIYVLFAGLFTACTDELIQLFFDGRSSEIKDVFIDFSGTVLGFFAAMLISKITKKLRSVK